MKRYLLLLLLPAQVFAGNITNFVVGTTVVNGTNISNVISSGGGGGSACHTVIPAISGILGYWPFDEGSGTTTADLSGSGATGTIVGSPTWLTPGKAGAHALQFNTRSDYVSTSVSLASTGEQTFAAWIYPTDLSGESGHNIIFAGDTVNNWLELTTAGHVLYHCYANNVEIEDSNTAITINHWTHICVTVADIGGGLGFTCKTYINGVLDDTQVSGQGLASINQIYWISGFPFTPGHYGFIGYIDEPSYFGRAIIQSEVTTLATCN